MRFALINQSRFEAESGLKGICPGCAQTVIAKCGTVRIPHWAHRNNKTCDSWWEPETLWHRTWKSNYPDQWQEIYLPDEQTGENHIADVCTSHGLVIEFQHSYIDPQERSSRENVHKNMVWVVDGTRLKNDYKRFVKGQTHFQSNDQKLFFVDHPEECFPAAWLESSVPVIFDFKGTEPVDDPLAMRSRLYCLFPIRIGRIAAVAAFSRETFLASTSNGEWISRVRIHMDHLNQGKKQHDNKEETQRLQLQLMTFQKFDRAPYGKSRIF